MDDWAAGRLAPLRPGEVPRQGGEIIVRIHTEPPSLNRIVDSDAMASIITENRIYESLVQIDPYDHPQYRLRPGLAERWDVSTDKLTYTFWLRRNVRWHDGTPFTARDVIATFEKVQDLTTKAMHLRSYTRDIESFRARDDFTVEFRFKEPYFLVMDGIFADVPIQAAHRIAHLSGTQYNEASSNSLNRHPIGTGPFRFESWVSNQRITLARDADYWGRAPYLDRVVFRIVKEATIALELATRNEVDIVTRIRPEQWAKMDRSLLGSHYNRLLFYYPNYAWIGYNEMRPFFGDARVRRAMTLLIDRPGIIKAQLYGLARPTECHFYFESSACDPSVQPLPYDPVAATNLLDAAGWQLLPDQAVRQKGGQALAFSLMIPAGSEEAARMATLVKESMVRAGVNMRIQRVEWSAFVKRLREHDFDACTLIWSNTSPRTDPTQIWHSSSIQGGSNYVGFRSGRADAIMDAARSEFDEDRRNGLYRDFGRLLHEQQPYTWLYTRPEFMLIHRRIHGARPTMMGLRYEDLWVETTAGGGKGSGQ